MSSAWTPRAFEAVNEQELDRIHRAAERHIHGYDATAAISRRHEQVAEFATLFDGDETGLVPERGWFVPDARGGIAAGAVVAMQHMAGLMRSDPPLAREYARSQRVLSALFVAPEHRGSGIGNALLDHALIESLADEARFVDGFVDTANGSVGFYRRTEAHVMPRGADIPGRPPRGIWRTFPPGFTAQGEMFYYDLWSRFAARQEFLCEICREPWAFDDAHGGTLECARCGRKVS